MSLDQFMEEMIPAIEETMQACLAQASGPEMAPLTAMMAYHLGWQGEGAGPEARGKRIRPLLLLLTAAAAGEAWRTALQAAAAVELLHNFSLIHDDIEDNSPLRRGRRTVWHIWGVPQAINTGDAMFTLAHLALLNLPRDISSEVILQAALILQQTCLELTQGQYLDIAYEKRTDLEIDAYWQMVGGKTAALLATCTELGALVAGAGPAQRQEYREFGRCLGLAFQAQDDLLGIWGDSALMGKSNQSDLVSGKKSLPVVYGLSQNGPFAERWRQGAIRAEQAAALAEQLRSEGAFDYTQENALRLTNKALISLENARPQGAAGDALRELAGVLLGRKA
jgi:geranylgeranyl diphosphate synthase type I